MLQPVRTKWRKAHKGRIHGNASRANFINYGSEQLCRDNGKLAIEGKDYVVNDGDIMHFRFNV